MEQNRRKKGTKDGNSGTKFQSAEGNFVLFHVPRKHILSCVCGTVEQKILIKNQKKMGYNNWLRLLALERSCHEENFFKKRIQEEDKNFDEWAATHWYVVLYHKNTPIVIDQ